MKLHFVNVVFIHIFAPKYITTTFRVMQDTKKQLIKNFILQNKIVTLDEIKNHLNGNVTMTIMRKLKELSYLSSYSHRGKYYTLGTVPQFSDQGLWSYNSVYFSKYDTLKNTCHQLLNSSLSGYTTHDMDRMLNVSSRLPLLNLYKEEKIFRTKFGGEFVYFSGNKQLKKQQIIIRESQHANTVFTIDKLSTQIITDELQAAILLFYCILDEKQKRLYAGLESLKIGHGGDTLISKLLNIDPETVSKGRKELVRGDFEKDRIRKLGAGRPEVKKKPEIICKIEQLLKYDTAGDPITGIKWTKTTTRKIADILAEEQIYVSSNTSGKLLKDMWYSLKINYKKIESDPKKSTPESREKRNQQFIYINQMRETSQKQNTPMISVDAKKKELVGNFKNQGAKWCKNPNEVNAYDFRSMACGIFIPYGIYDMDQNKGFVVGGVSYNTAEFAVNSIVKWWKTKSNNMIAKQKSLLIIADGGGSNGSRTRLWKVCLQKLLCNKYGINVTVCHYPPGTSKYNPIEHRLFSEISKNWAGEPLKDYERILNYICTTKTRTGLKVKASIDETVYKKGIKISDAQMNKINIKYHNVLPQWNYTIFPSENPI